MANHLKYLRDLPRFDAYWGKDEHPKDIFKHSGYINALMETIKECPAPFCIGLFGGWGTGKTGIVNALCVELDKKENKKIKYLNFDVWKYSADSLRRQILLRIDKEWFNNDLKFNEKLYINTHEGAQYTTKFSWKIFSKNFYWLIPVLTGLFLIKYFYPPIGFACKDWIDLISKAILPVIIAVITSIRSKGVVTTIVKDTEKPNSPEQFEDMFKQAINHPSIKDHRKVFIIDNLDRCQSSKVLEVLTGISTFLGVNDCIYLIPCDHEKIKNHISKGMGEKDGKDVIDEDEFLRKLFNVEIYLRPVYAEYLLDYIKDLAEKIGINNSVDITNFQAILFTKFMNNPRRAKQILNNLVASYNLALDLEKADGDMQSLPKDRISKDLGFLLKILIIQNYYPKAYKYFLNNIGSFNNLEQYRKNLDFDSQFLNDKELEEILDEPTDGYRLRNFLDATNRITNENADLFFTFSGNASSELFDKIIASLMRKDEENALDLIKINIEKDGFLGNFEIETKIRLNNLVTPLTLRENLISALQNVNEKIEFRLDVMIGSLFESIPSDVLLGLGENINPSIWRLGKGDIPKISYEKLKTVARIIYSRLIPLFSNVTLDVNNTLPNYWNKIQPHIKGVNENISILGIEIIEHYRELLSKLILINLSSKDYLESLWEWLLPTEGNIPEIIKSKKILRNAVNGLTPEISKTSYSVGLLIARLSEIADKEILNNLFAKSIECLTNDFSKVDVEDPLYPPNVVLNWVLNSNVNISKEVANQVFDTLIKESSKWENEYDIDAEWFSGFVELYKVLEEDKRKIIRKKLTEAIQVDPELYEKEFKRSKFGKFPLFNSTMFDSAASNEASDLGNTEEKWKGIIYELIEKIYNFQSKDILKYLFESYWKSKELYAKYIVRFVNEVLIDKVDRIDDNKPIIKNALEQFLNKDFWGNATSLDRDAFLSYSMELMNRDSRITQNDKDTLLSPILRSLKDIDTETFKAELSKFRFALFDNLSNEAKERALNYVWDQIKIDLKKGPDTEFVMMNLQFMKSSDRNEIVDELLDQLNSNQQVKIDFFIEFGIKEEIINVNADKWIHEVDAYLRQYQNNESSNKIKEKINEINNSLTDNELKNRISSMINE